MEVAAGEARSVLFTPMAQPQSADSASRGWLIPIGGKLSDPAIVDRFVQLCGGPTARIVVIPTASTERDTGAEYHKVFTQHGVRETRVLPFRRRSDCDDDDWLHDLRAADGVFITGGDQLRLATVMNGTPAARIMQERHAEDGLHVAGTSAGAAFLSAQMIARGAEGATPRAGMVTLTAGLGLTGTAIIDQHFRQRDRIGRLLTAIAYNPHLLGLGIDENTAAFMGPDGRFEVHGEGSVTVIDPTDLVHNSIADIEHSDAVTLTGIRLHLLGTGASYCLESRTPIVPDNAAFITADR